MSTLPNTKCVGLHTIYFDDIPYSTNILNTKLK